MDARHRRAVARVAAPAAFLAAATTAVLLGRAGLEGGSGSPGAPVTDTTPTVAATRRSETAPPRSRPKPRYYTLRSGDTLARVAGRLNTTVERLLALNPGIRPTSLHVGQKVRVQ